MSDWSFGDLPRNHFGAIYADPPWSFKVWSTDTGYGRSASAHYVTQSTFNLSRLEVSEIAARDCALFMWACWPTLKDALTLIDAWGFEYKTCAFCWTKADGRQIEMFEDNIEPAMLMGYWTRADSEVCLLATRGKPKRLNADVRQAIIEPRREHSRKPDCVPVRIERLVSGPYLELFARTTRPGWSSWGNETTKFSAPQFSDGKG